MLRGALFCAPLDCQSIDNQRFVGLEVNQRDERLLMKARKQPLKTPEKLLGTSLPQRVAEQEGLEGGEGGGEGNRLLRAFEEGGEAGEEGNVGAGGAGDGFLEFGGVGRFAEKAGFTFTEAVLEGAVAAGAVGVQEVANMKWSRGRGVRSRAGDCRRWGRRLSRSSFRARATRHRRPGGCTMSRLHRW